MPLIQTRKHYKVRLLVREPTRRERWLYKLGLRAFRDPQVTLVREYLALSPAAALEAARVELGFERSAIGKVLFVEEL